MILPFGGGVSERTQVAARVQSTGHGAESVMSKWAEAQTESGWQGEIALGVPSPLQAGFIGHAEPRVSCFLGTGDNLGTFWALYQV